MRNKTLVISIAAIGSVVALVTPFFFHWIAGGEFVRGKDLADTFAAAMFFGFMVPCVVFYIAFGDKE